jgi:Fur family transcriptional regulator, ferric uptake regulator
VLGVKQFKAYKEKINLYFKSHNLKNTKQRELIVRKLFFSQKHLSIENLYYLVKKVDPSVGIATVYRCIKILRKGNFIIEINSTGNNILYEFNFNDNHHHLLCVSCEKVIEFISKNMKEEQLHLEKEYSFSLIYHRYELFGYCQDCRQNIA